MKRLILALLVSHLAMLLQAQTAKDSIPVVHFQLVDVSNGKPIPLGHIVSQKLRKGIATDMLGYFRLPISVGDTLYISALGYHPMRIPSWGQFNTDSLYYPIRLTPQTYEIKEVRITRFGSYQRFIREVANMELPKSEQEIMQIRLEEYIRTQITRMELMNLPSARGGFAFGKDWFTKQREKIEAKRVEEQKWDIIFKKFSAGIVAELTGLEDIDAIRFMEFCNFTEGYLLIASEYEVRKRVLDNFEVYKNLKRQNHEHANQGAH